MTDDQVGQGSQGDGAEYSDGVLWWHLKIWPGKKKAPFGGVPKFAAYLFYRVEVGSRFTMRDLRTALGDDAPDDAEHLNRRLRELKDHDWDFSSYKDQAGQEVDAYVLTKKGKRIWLGERNPSKQVSAKVAREVFERDSNRCVICGIGAGEPYDGDPDKRARLTAGHRIPGARRGKATADELQTECSRCNETVNDTHTDPESLGEVMSVVKKLSARSKDDLLDWLGRGYRLRNSTDVAFDRIRRLSPLEREEIVKYLRSATNP